jgi:hypothetical protein
VVVAPGAPEVPSVCCAKDVDAKRRQARLTPKAAVLPRDSMELGAFGLVFTSRAPSLLKSAWQSDCECKRNRPRLVEQTYTDKPSVDRRQLLSRREAVTSANGALAPTVVCQFPSTSQVERHCSC